MHLSLSREELASWASNSVAFHGIDLSRVSTLLLAQIMGYERTGSFSTFDLTQPIKVLEGLAKSDHTGPAEPFRHDPLAGLWKKHFTSPRFLVRNLLNFHQSKFGEQHFTSVWNEAAKASRSDVIDDAFTNYVAHHSVVDPLELRSAASRLTGEWLVFCKHESKNYYLTIAFHTEDQSEIRSRAEIACAFDRWPVKL